LATTATANSRVVDDISEQLGSSVSAISDIVRFYTWNSWSTIQWPKK